MNTRLRKPVCGLFIVATLTAGIFVTPSQADTDSFSMTLTFRQSQNGEFIWVDNIFLSQSAELSLANSTNEIMLVTICDGKGNPIWSDFVDDSELVRLPSLHDPKSGITDIEIKIVSVISVQTFTFILVD